MTNIKDDPDNSPHWRTLLRYTLLLFAANQLLEFTVIRLFGFDYSALCAWDCTWYRELVERGYDLTARLHPAHPKGDVANWAFFPGFVLAGKAVSTLTGLSAGVSVIVAARLFFIAAIYAMMRLGGEYNPRVHPLFYGGVTAFQPYAIYANTGYTEPLFLLVSCWFFYHLRKRRFLAAGLAGGLLTAVRVVGVAALATYAVRAVQSLRDIKREQRERAALGFLLLPLGLTLFMTYLYHLMGDALAFSHVMRAWDRFPRSPVAVVWEGLVSGNALYCYWAVLSLLALCGGVWLLARKQHDLGLFSLQCTLLPLVTMLQSMPRYIWWQAPLLLLVASMLSRRWLWAALGPASIAALVFVYSVWLSGKWGLT